MGLQNLISLKFIKGSWNASVNHTCRNVEEITYIKEIRNRTHWKNLLHGYRANLFLYRNGTLWLLWSWLILFSPQKFKLLLTMLALKTFNQDYSCTYWQLKFTLQASNFILWYFRFSRINYGFYSIYWLLQRTQTYKKFHQQIIWYINQAGILTKFSMSKCIEF